MLFRSRGVVTRRGRQIRRLQWTIGAVAVLTVLCIASLELVMPARRDALRPVLNQLADVVRWRHGAGANSAAHGEAAIPRGETAKMLRGLAGLDITRLGSIAAPTSALEHPNRRVSDAIAVGYNALVLAAIRDSLEEKPSIVLPAPLGAPPCDPSGAPPTPLPDRKSVV